MSRSVATSRTGSGPAVMTKPGVTSPTPSNFALKLIMASSGVMFVGYLFVHMFGNLKAFPFMGGEHSFNDYAVGLRTLLYPYVPKEMILWLLRVVLLVAFVAHIYAAVTLRVRAKAARGSFARSGYRSSHSPLARWMLVTGVLILVYVVVHLLDLTFGTEPIAAGHATITVDGTEYPNAYANLIASLSRWWMAAFYAVINLLIFGHVVQGGWGVGHDLGITGKRARAAVVWVITALAAAVVAGNVLLPLTIAFGWLPEASLTH